MRRSHLQQAKMPRYETVTRGKAGRNCIKVRLDDGVDTLASSIKAILQQFGDLEARARALGIFTGNRELLTCHKCGLMEDVLISGQLITCHRASDGQDTGLRFIEPTTSAGRFRCPECGSEVAPDEAEMRTFIEAPLRERRDD